MTDAKLQELERLCAEATEGPWSYDTDENEIHSDTMAQSDGDPAHICEMMGPTKASNAAFIAASRTAIPELISTVRSLQVRVGELEAAGTWADAAAFLDNNAGNYCECREDLPALMCEKHAQTYSRSLLEEVGRHVKLMEARLSSKA